MPVLKNSRQEAYCQALAKGQKPEAAYASAGYKPHRQAAHRLLTNVDVRARVTELQERAAQRVEWTVADRLAALQRIADKNEDEDPRVTVAAIIEANKMQGSYAPRQKESNDGSFQDAFSAFIKSIVQAKPALPVGQARLRATQANAPAASRLGDIIQARP